MLWYGKVKIILGREFMLEFLLNDLNYSTDADFGLCLIGGPVSQNKDTDAQQN